MFVQVSPAAANEVESTCSLTFATRVRSVELGQAKQNISDANAMKIKEEVGLCGILVFKRFAGQETEG